MTLDSKTLPFGLHPREDTASLTSPGVGSTATEREAREAGPPPTKAVDPSQKSWAASHPPSAALSSKFCCGVWRAKYYF